MSRLTNSIRESIRKKSITAAFKDREQSLKNSEHVLGMVCYEAMIPEAERKTAAKMPKHWLQLDSCLRFNANGWVAHLNVKEAVPVPFSTHCSQLGSLPAELAEQVQNHLTAVKKLREANWQAVNEMDGFLAQFKSIKQMRDAWPEGEPFFAEYDVERKPNGVPAVRVAEINKLLNLGKAAA